MRMTPGCKRGCKEGQRLFTSDEFYRMGESDGFGPEERVELVGGLICTMTPINPRHADAVEFLVEELRRALNGRAKVRTQEPVHLDGKSDPQPDVAVVMPRPYGYLDRHPQPREIFLLAEVSDSTARYDKTVPGYAMSGVPEVWVVDLLERAVVVYREPSGGRYLSEQSVSHGEAVSPMAFSDLAIPVSRFIR
jgi:Uma2 family endonuclease